MQKKSIRAKKGTFKRLLGLVFKINKWQIILVVLFMLIATFANVGGMSMIQSVLTEANNIYEYMIKEADIQLNSEYSDLGVKFGGREASSVRESRYHTIRGLANKGLNNGIQANKSLNKAVELSHSNIWANAELENM